MLIRVDSCGECPASYEVSESPLACRVGVKFEYIHKSHIDDGIPSWCPLREREFNCAKACPAFGIGMAHNVFPHTDKCSCHICIPENQYTSIVVDGEEVK